MSYNNYVDADAALRAAYDFVEPAVAIIKHANPCGIAVARRRRPDRARPPARTSATGVGVRRGHRGQPPGHARRWPRRSSDIFTEVIVAPGLRAGRPRGLRLKKNLRVLQLPAD